MLGTFGLDDGQMLDRAALATLTLTNAVYFVRRIGIGEFQRESRVTRKPGQMEYAVSVNEDGSPNSDLLNVAKISCDHAALRSRPRSRKQAQRPASEAGVDLVPRKPASRATDLPCDDPSKVALPTIARHMRSDR